MPLLELIRSLALRWSKNHLTDMPSWPQQYYNSTLAIPSCHMPVLVGQPQRVRWHQVASYFMGYLPLKVITGPWLNFTRPINNLPAFPSHHNYFEEIVYTLWLRTSLHFGVICLKRLNFDLHELRRRRDESSCSSKGVFQNHIWNISSCTGMSLHLCDCDCQQLKWHHE